MFSYDYDFVQGEYAERLGRSEKVLMARNKQATARIGRSPVLLGRMLKAVGVYLVASVVQWGRNI
jgi:hypothetical protein